jgi:hypothetical protein
MGGTVYDHKQRIDLSLPIDKYLSGKYSHIPLLFYGEAQNMQTYIGSQN